MPGIDHEPPADTDTDTDTDTAADEAGLGDSEAGPGAVPGEAGARKSGGESGGGACPAPRDRADGDDGGQPGQAYSGGGNPNATSTREASHDRAA